MKHFQIAILFFALIFGCSHKPDFKEKKTWDKIVKDVEVTLTLKKPDSIKYMMIEKIFKDNQVTIGDYQNFYHEYVYKAPLGNLAFIEKIQDLISAEYNQTAREERKKIESEPLRITKPESQDQDNLELKKKPGRK
jgi:hypothetical protein